MNRGAAAGLVVMVASETATLAGIEPFASWNTPIAWTGFIVFADSVVYQARGDSWLRTAPREFLVLAMVSIPLWLVFEWFNLFIRNWFYVGLPQNAALRYFGYAWSFATISPALFEGAELVGVWRGAHNSAPGAVPERPAWTTTLTASVVLGAALLLWPIVWPSQYLAAPVWLGFIFLLDPLNYRLGEPSLLGDLRRGLYDRLINLVLSGFLCGVLWEFWNYWARTKWHYTVPIMEDFKIFEMPLPGYFGFPAFALECFTMYVTVRWALVRLTGARFARQIGL
jgi:hypothetical protein